MILHSSNPSKSPIKIRDNTLKNANETVVTNRTVLIKLIDVKTVVHNPHKKINGICPNSAHTGNTWTWQYFNLSLNELDHNDFYILTDPIKSDYSSSWLLDRPERVLNDCNELKFNSDPENINQRLSNLLGNDPTGVFWLHVRSTGKFNTYILSVPKGTDYTYVNLNSVNPEPWFFVLEVCF